MLMSEIVGIKIFYHSMKFHQWMGPSPKTRTALIQEILNC